MAIASLVTARIDGLRRYAGSIAWGPFVQLSRSTILSVFQNVKAGQLKITDTNDQETICGEQSDSVKGPRVEITVHKDTFWVRLLLFADMGFAESYMLGEFSCPNLVAFFELFILNRTHLSNGTTIASSLSSAIGNLARSTNTLANARLNIHAHYDISNEMFAAFLSPDMTYSCPIWLPKSNPKCLEESLQSAQITKLNRFIESAHIKSTDHVLEIGTGWGSFAMEAVARTGCRVTSLTLSTEQKELAEKRIAAAGFTDNIEVLLCDYRALPVPRGGRLYDKVVSIEMLEAVGREYLETYFECIDKLLKPEGGIAVFQCITMPETRYEAYYSSTDFINKYIFPGGHLPSISQLISAITSGSKNKLILDSLIDIGPHYARTLRCWRENFEANFESRIRPALLDEHKGMTGKDVELFRRKWEYYFTYCEAGFRTCSLGDVILTVKREGSVQIAEDVVL